MPDTPPFDDKYLEAFDFIMQFLQEHEHNIDGLVDRLATLREQVPDITTLKTKLEGLDAKVIRLQSDIANLKDHFQSKQIPQKDAPMKIAVEHPAFAVSGARLTIHCQQWDDFKMLAREAQTVAFSYDESALSTEVYAFNGHQLIIYTGKLPNLPLAIGSWLSTELCTPTRNIFEGSASIR